MERRCSTCLHEELSPTEFPCLDCIDDETYSVTYEFWEPAIEVVEPKPSTPISPSHYSRFTIQPAEFISANKLGWEVGNVIKYVCRYPYKNGVEDLKKAIKNIEILIAVEEGRSIKEVLS